jgi:ABC-type lipoprotein export system ATPase subunit
MSLLTCTNIHKSFKLAGRQPLQILKGIHLTVHQGEFVVIVGPSGAGKSTLLHILGGLDKPNEGSVTIDGDDVYRLKDIDRSRLRNIKVGFVFQFYHLLPELTAQENVLLPALVKANTSTTTELEPAAKELLDHVGLKERISHKPKELSGGEQQRVAIARALINKPKIVFCDEPTGNLDSKTGKGIIDLLLGLNKDQKQTLVVVTHDESIAKKADRVMHMLDGKLIS